VFQERTSTPNNIMEGVGGVGEKCELDQIDFSSAKVFRYEDCRLGLASHSPSPLQPPKLKE